MLKIADFSKTASADGNAQQDSDDSEPEMYIPDPRPQGKNRYIIFCNMDPIFGRCGDLLVG
jgi:hypothetical protein